MIKKIFLILLLTLFLSTGINVYAQEATFREGTYINAYMNKIYSTQKNIINYQKARFFVNNNTNGNAYCIQPTAVFNEGSIYNSTTRPKNLSDDQINIIKEAVNQGLGYKDRNTVNDYFVTQLYIWRVADPEGSYYFTDSLNGQAINTYDSALELLDSRVKEALIKPSFINQTYTIKEGQELELKDNNQVLNKFTSSIGIINNNTLKLSNLEEGTYTITLNRKNNNTSSNEATFYESDNSQDMITLGYNNISYTLNINVIKTKLTVNKIDSNTKTTESNCEASLTGTSFDIYNEKDEIIDTIIINEEGTGTIEDLELGNYYLLEDKVGNGYIKDTEKHPFTIDINNTKVTITIENTPINKEINIHKTYGDIDEFNNEENVNFEVYNSNNELIKTITTDNNGNTNVKLNYGTYTIKQINSKEGYTINEPIIIRVDNLNNEYLELKDYKIKVPNTYIKQSLFRKILEVLLKGLNICLKI